MRVFPLRKRFVVFSMPYRERIENSLLYRPNSFRGSFSRVEEIWILGKGKDCRLDLSPGDHCWVDDSFELEPTNLNLWEEFCNDPAFLTLKDLQIKYSGFVKTQLVLEDSILIHDPEYQCATVQKLQQFG